MHPVSMHFDARLCYKYCEVLYRHSYADACATQTSPRPKPAEAVCQARPRWACFWSRSGPTPRRRKGLRNCGQLSLPGLPASTPLWRDAVREQSCSRNIRQDPKSSVKCVSRRLQAACDWACGLTACAKTAAWDPLNKGLGFHMGLWTWKCLAELIRLKTI